jgi:hypothetical protein
MQTAGVYTVMDPVNFSIGRLKATRTARSTGRGLRVFRIGAQALLSKLHIAQMSFVGRPQNVDMISAQIVVCCYLYEYWNYVFRYENSDRLYETLR